MSECGVRARCWCRSRARVRRRDLALTVALNTEAHERHLPRPWGALRHTAIIRIGAPSIAG